LGFLRWVCDVSGVVWLVVFAAPGISASPSEENMRYFNVMILGPSQSPYEGGVFKLELFLPEEYPMAPPKVRFLTKIYHPNIDKVSLLHSCFPLTVLGYTVLLNIYTHTAW